MPDTAEIVATTFLVNPGAESHEWITVELTCFAGEGPHRPAGDTWAVRQRGYCLDVDGDWVYEPIPSSRDEGFLARTRWPRDEAIARARVVA